MFQFQKGKQGPKGDTGSAGGLGIWGFFSMMYIITSDTVYPIDKLEFFWRILAGPINFLPFI